MERIDAAKMPDEVRKVAVKQVSRMRQMASTSPEYNIARTYLEWLLDIPWNVTTEDRLDVPAARAILEAEHDGLDKVKKRILEFIAVRKLAPDKHGPILLPGRAARRRQDLAGQVDRVGPGPQVRAGLARRRARRGRRSAATAAPTSARCPAGSSSGLKKAGTMNPVFVLDEIDKLSNSLRGDPASAMLEVLDPEQNNDFVDHYLEVPVDLSQVMFIWPRPTSSTPSPAPLLDRMEVIEIPGYTEREKLAIALHHLRAQADGRARASSEDSCASTTRRSLEIIHHYTREAGVRNLERELRRRCAGAPRSRSPSGGASSDQSVAAAIEVRPARAAAVLRRGGRASPEVGVVTGLALDAGRRRHPVHRGPRSCPASGELRLTGQLGDVMKESARAALSWVRSNAAAAGHRPRPDRDLRHPHPRAVRARSRRTAPRPAWPSRWR